MSRRSPLAGALTALVLLAAPSVAQNRLTTLFASDNGGSIGGAVYFDVTVTNGVRIVGIDVNTGTAGPIHMNVHTTALGGSFIGNETNPAAWTLRSPAAGVGMGRDNPSPMVLAQPLQLVPGTYGVALEGVDFGHEYTDGTFTNQHYSDANLALALGSANNTAFTSTPFNPRVANLTLRYTLLDGVFPSFAATPRVGTAPLTVQFTDTTYTSGSVTLREWDFDGDGQIDSTVTNPQFTYTSTGEYTVSLRVTDTVHGQATTTAADYIRVYGATNHTRGAELLEYRFDEPRYARVANAASTNRAPAHGVVQAATGAPNPAWQADAGRVRFMGNDPGTGCLGADAVAPYEARVDSGWPIEIAGSHTIAFWARHAQGSATSYVFGSGTGNARCYFTGSYLSLRDWGLLPFVDSASDPDALSGWHHWALVVDDAAGTAQWYLDGGADGAVVTFVPNTFALSAGNFVVGGYGTTTSLFTRYFDLDDFRVYARALTAAELGAVMQGENPSATTFGDPCPGPSSVPFIAGGGGAPALGNAGFRIVVGNLEAGRPRVLNFALFARGALLPIDLTPLLGAGCVAEILPDLAGIPLAGTPTVTVPLPIPNLAGLAGANLYTQALVLGTTGAVTPVLDVHLQP